MDLSIEVKASILFTVNCFNCSISQQIPRIGTRDNKQQLVKCYNVSVYDGATPS